MKNTMLLFMPVVPIILALFYDQMGGEEEIPLLMIYMVVGVTFASVTTGCIMMMMYHSSLRYAYEAVFSEAGS